MAYATSYLDDWRTLIGGSASGSGGYAGAASGPLGGRAHDFGGSLSGYIEDTDWADLPDSALLAIAGGSYTLEVTAIAGEASPATTASFRLYDVTNAAAVAGSDASAALSSTAKTRIVGAAFDLGTAAAVYKMQMKTSQGAANRVAARARVF